MRPGSESLWLRDVVLLILLGLLNPVLGDYTLSCESGYRVTGLKRVASPFDRSKAVRNGALTLECEKVYAGENNTLEDVVCEPLTTTPMCNGEAEGCGANQWLGGLQVFVVENTTNTELLDPICCKAKGVTVDPVSCASERINSPRQPFEHTILAEDLVYRGLKCWHQYDSNNTLIDLVWKFEICQYTTDTPQTQKPFVAEHCPPCECHCGIDVCADGTEPVRIIHKRTSPERCHCDCMCNYECLSSNNNTLS